MRSSSVCVCTTWDVSLWTHINVLLTVVLGFRLVFKMRSLMPFKRDLALQNIPLSNNLSKHNPELEMNTSLEVHNIICPPQEPTRRRVRWLIPNSSRCIGNMYHLFHAQVQYKLCISILDPQFENEDLT